MGLAHTVKDPYVPKFVTFTVHQWVDVSTRKEYIDVFLDSIRYCQKEEGLNVFGGVVMTNHIHLILSSKKQRLSDIIRDFKKYTSSKIIQAIKLNNRESRKNWMLWLFNKDGKIWFWEEGYLNPVRAGIVEKEEEYVYSSCGDYYKTRITGARSF